MTPVFTPVKLALSADQAKKIRDAVHSKTEVGINVTPEMVGSGEYTLRLGKRNYSALQSNLQKGKGMKLRLTKGELSENAKDGGFLPALAGLLSNPVVGAIAAPVISGLAGSAFNAIKGLIGGKEEKPAKSRKAPAKKKPAVIDDDDDDDDDEGSGVRGGLLYANGNVGSGIKTKLPVVKGEHRLNMFA